MNTAISPTVAPKRSNLLFALLMLALFSAAGMALFSLSYLKRRSDFAQNRTRYEALISALKAQGMKPGEVIAFQTDGTFSAASLHPKKDSESDESLMGRVWARRLATGEYQAAVVTGDEGNFGLRGYLYSEVPLIRLSKPGRNVDAPGKLTLVGKQLDTRWWAAYNSAR